ncbi:hypothetical protein GCK72_026265 [Caenorhabditis remanei]|uniref:Uncharacterized protein n=1 Tax=Caenorhabditis remanei TaxID=31234 RepID=A0A6A5G4D6_CAERE|nr:hypothetical protein GCK72_026265 [Caenorhabditis remanei]KAF1749796.1 hypothetical protein GCK72_026265 [Caenorhabditis remanei]
MLKWNDPRAIDETIEQVRAKVRILTGGGGKRQVKSLEQISIDFENEDGTQFMTDKGFWFNERRYGTFNGQVLFEELERITQSKEDIDIDDTFVIAMHVFNKFEGKGGRFKKYIGSSEKIQCEAADNILKKANLSTMGQSFGLDDLEKIAKAFPEYKFEVYIRPPYDKLYHIIKQFNDTAEKIITIAFKKEDEIGHYDFIKPSLFYMKTTYCHKCKKKTLSTGHSQVCSAKCDKSTLAFL